MEIVLLGDRGRDHAAVDHMPGHRVHVIGGVQNPGLVELVEASGGQFHLIDSITNVDRIAGIVRSIKPDMFFTNFEAAIEAGVVDAVRQGGGSKLLVPCPNRATAQLEWDKWELRKIIAEIDEETGSNYNPLNRMVSTEAEARDALAFFESLGMEVALKPRNLAGGKGVKVMGPHLRGYKEDDSADERPSALEYALKVLADKTQTGLEIQQKFDKSCPEFTLQILTDGTTMIRPPATYDYPYREDGDTGPGTGSTGSFSMHPDEQMPFLTEADYNEAMELMAKVLDKLKQRGLDYKGVLYPTFFKTPEGLKIVEINARGGEPELINILDLMEDDVDYAEVLKLIALGELAEDSVRLKKLASALLILMPPEYGYDIEPVEHEFSLDPEVIKAHGCRIRYMSAERIRGNNFRTTGTSRTLGISALGKTPWEARSKIDQAVAAGFRHPLVLQFRRDIASEAYIKSLAA